MRKRSTNFAVRERPDTDQPVRKRLPLSEIRPIPRRGLSRDEAAMYIGLSGSKFDELVADGRMPKPIWIDGRKVWDIRQLDSAFEALGGAGDSHDETWSDYPAVLVNR